MLRIIFGTHVKSLQINSKNQNIWRVIIEDKHAEKYEFRREWCKELLNNLLTLKSLLREPNIKYTLKRPSVVSIDTQEINVSTDVYIFNVKSDLSAWGYVCM